MELTFAAAIVIIILFFIFRSPIRKITDTMNRVVEHGNNVVIVNITENTAELNQRMTNAMKKLSDAGGPIDFEEAYLEAMGKKKNNRK